MTASPTIQVNGPTIQVNGEVRQLAAGTLRALVEAEAVNPGARGLAVAVNGAVVPRRAWDATRLAPGDEVEIVKLFAGG